MPPIGESMLAKVAPKASLMLTVPQLIVAGDGAGPVAVLAVDRGVEAVVAVVGAGDGVGLVVEAVERDDRAEGLVAEAGHVGRDALEDGRLVEVRAEVGAGPAAGEHPRALGDGVVDVGDDGVELGLGDQRAHVVAPVEAWRRASSPRCGRRSARRTGRRPGRRRTSAPSRRTAGRRWRTTRARRPRRPSRGRRRAAPAAGSCRRARASSRSAARRSCRAMSLPVAVEPVKQT